MLKTVSVTYKAPPGDSKVAEIFGHTLYDGKAETVTVDEDQLQRLQGNRHFKCGEAKDAAEAKPDPEKEKAAAAAALAEENAKRAAQGQPPVEEPQPPKSGEGHKGEAHKGEAHQTTKT
jgi:hypothetical protein